MSERKSGGRAGKRGRRRAKARELLNGRALVVGGFAQGHVGRFDAAAFERYVAMAAEFGATHIKVGWLPFQYGTWFLPDNTDPYTSWSNVSLGLFRVFPPKALRRWIPPAAARPLQRVIEGQVRILRRYGLKGQVDGCEPLWLPEDVYRSYPHWRGPQCELGRIAGRAYFAPSIDEPEVLDLYREALAEIARRFPEIDAFSFLGNDSGAGISWSPCLYPGMNGPTRWRTRDPGARIADWLKAMQEGAAAGGARVTVNVFSSGLPPGTVAAARALLGPGQFVNWKGKDGVGIGGPGAGMSGGLWSAFYPAVGLGNPIDFAAGLQSVYSNPKGDHATAGLSYDEFHMPVARMILEAFLEEPGTGLAHRDRILLRAAARMAGSAEGAETLVGVWNEIKLAEFGMTRIPQKGLGSLTSPWCNVSMRWLIRPLVPRPDRLSPAETAYFRRFMFARDKEADARSFAGVLGKPVFQGSCAVWMTRWNLVDVIGRLESARARVLTLADGRRDRRAAQGLALYAARLGAAACLAETLRNTVMYQYALDTAGEPQFGPNMMDYDDNIIYDQRALVLRKTAREELDNAAELLKILEASPGGTVLYRADAEREESVFTLGPDVEDGLRRKMRLMMDRWQEYEEMYPATKVWDFEPEPKGNIVRPGPTGEKQPNGTAATDQPAVPRQSVVARR